MGILLFFFASTDIVCFVHWLMFSCFLQFHPSTVQKKMGLASGSCRPSCSLPQLQTFVLESWRQWYLWGCHQSFYFILFFTFVGPILTCLWFTNVTNVMPFFSLSKGLHSTLCFIFFLYFKCFTDIGCLFQWYIMALRVFSCNVKGLNSIHKRLVVKLGYLQRPWILSMSHNCNLFLLWNFRE